MDEQATDVAVIGAGPIGIELAVSLKRARIEYLHFDARQIAYTISWFPPQTRFFSSNERIAIAGVPLQTADQMKASREEYLAYLRGVVEQFDLDVHTYEPVVAIERGEGRFLIGTQPAGGRRRYRARRIVLCTGGTDHPRRLNVPGEDLPHVSHYFHDPHPYFRKRLLVVGGKNSAVETALRCHHAGARVSLSYRRPQLDQRSIKYWLMPEITSLIESGRLKGYFGTIPTRITPTDVTLAPWSEPAGEAGGATGEPIRAEFDFVLLQVGFEQDTSLLELAGVDLHGPCRAPWFDEQTMETHVPGIYVAGTVVGGTQEKYRVFIENCHVHVRRIVAALTGAAPPQAGEIYARPES